MFHIGIEDLAANAFIALLQEDEKCNFITYDELELYGEQAINHMYLEDDIRIVFKNTDWNYIYRKIVGDNSSEFAKMCRENGFEI